MGFFASNSFASVCLQQVAAAAASYPIHVSSGYCVLSLCFPSQEQPVRASAQAIRPMQARKYFFTVAAIPYQLMPVDTAIMSCLKVTTPDPVES